ncbi:MAG: OmpA family protein [Gammaproteobacteria bacterium]|nr:OmpA family protein [Gammaproteobacteria bacterium]
MLGSHERRLAPVRGGNPMWNNLSRILFVFVLIIAGTASYLYWGYGGTLRRQSADRLERTRELALENQRLKQEVVLLSNRMNQEITRLSKQKQDEIARIRNTRSEMIRSLQGEVAQGQIKITQLADRLSVNIVNRLLFPSGEARISRQGEDVLRRVGVVLAKVHHKTIRVEGFTDNVPPGASLKDRYPTNWELSTARATNVVRFLQDSAEVNPGLMEAVGMGQYHPIASNRTAAGRSRNRCIEIVLAPRYSALAARLARSAAPAGKGPAVVAHRASSPRTATASGTRSGPAARTLQSPKATRKPRHDPK